MNKKKIYTKEGKPYITNDNKELVEFTFEEGDLFIPVQNHYITKQDGKYDKYILPCKVKDATGKLIMHNDSDRIFVKLTLSQKNTLKKLKESNVIFTENLFCCYKYKSEKYGDQLGIGLYNKHNVVQKNFSDFEELLKNKKK